MPAHELRLPVEVSDEPLVGWRCWYVLPHEGLLRPIYKRGLVWKPRQAHEAVCPEDPHEVPADGCKCGVWAVCHPMLLNEVSWVFAPPDGVSVLPGVVVVGQVALWGKIVEHERGWRGGAAYPRHLYALTDDPMVAETLRERYGVPVEWGEDANQLRRLLPPSLELAKADDAPTLREVLLEVLHQGLAPEWLIALAERVVEGWKEITQPPAARRRAARQALQVAVGHPARRHQWFYAYTAHADARALAGHALAARRVLWVRLVEEQRRTAEELWDKLSPMLQRRDRLLEDLAGGVSRGPNRKGRPYPAHTLYQKHRELLKVEKEILALVPDVEALAAITIPTYREWCAVAQGVISPRTVELPSEEIRREWHREAMHRQQQLAEQERTLALQRHQLIRDREAFETEQAAVNSDLEEACAQLATERATLRADVIAAVERDRAELLQEVGELERRRRAALAMLPGPWPPSERPSTLASGKPPLGPHPLKAPLVAAGITQEQIARAAGVSRSAVCKLLAGRAASRRIVKAAERLLRQQGTGLMEASTR
jgi:hypothetical protein